MIPASITNAGKNRKVPIRAGLLWMFVFALGTAMKLQSLARFDPSQAALPPNSSAGSFPFQKDDRPDTSTSGSPDGQLFVDPDAIPPYGKSPFDSNPSPLDATVFLGNTHPKEGSSAPVVFFKWVPSVQNRFVLLQKWEGTILQVSEDSFFARLVDLTNSGPDEEAEFPLEEVSDADRSLVEPGAVFYWNIGYIDSVSGQHTRASVIRFRQLPVWRSEELERAKHRAQRISDLLDWR